VRWCAVCGLYVRVRPAARVVRSCASGGEGCTFVCLRRRGLYVRVRPAVRVRVLHCGCITWRVYFIVGVLLGVCASLCEFYLVWCQLHIAACDLASQLPTPQSKLGHVSWRVRALGCFVA
jgi:hypothetical protein